jgi:hypothetical protein
MKLQKSFFLHSELDDYPFVTNNGLKGQQAHSPGQRSLPLRGVIS